MSESIIFLLLDWEGLSQELASDSLLAMETPLQRAQEQLVVQHWHSLLQRHHGRLLAWRIAERTELLIDAPRGLALAKLVLLLKVLSAKALGKQMRKKLRWGKGYRARSLSAADAAGMRLALGNNLKSLAARQRESA